MESRPNNPEKSRRIGAAKAFVDTHLAAGRVAFPMPEFMQASGLSSVAAKFQLLRLGRAVVRVTPRQAFYLIVAPEHRAMGAPPPAWWLQDYFHWLGRPYYLALQSAAGVYGSNPQALQVTQVMTDRPIRPLTVGRTQVRFFVKTGIQRTPTQALDQAYAPLTVSTPEATAFDLIRYSAKIGGIERAAETIGPMLPALRVRELRAVLELEWEAPATQRLGFVLDALGSQKLARTVRDWLPERPAKVPLSPQRGDRGGIPLNHRWMVLNNSRELNP
jgi:hypothetical protein